MLYSIPSTSTIWIPFRLGLRVLIPKIGLHSILPLTMADAVPQESMQGVEAPAVVEVDVEAPEEPEKPKCETLYIQNLNEKIKLDGAPCPKATVIQTNVLTVLKSSLKGLFKPYGVLDVVAHKNLRMRGQAFVSFESPEQAEKAMNDVRGFPLYSKSMVRLLGLVPFSRR